MALVYFDSSALVKLLVEEPGSSAAAALWEAADLTLSSPLAYPEVRAALAAARRSRRITAGDLRWALATWERYWQAMSKVTLTVAITEHAGQLTAEHVLGGADAVHLASAIAIDDGETVFAVWDNRLRAAAQGRGMTVAPGHDST